MEDSKRLRPPLAEGATTPPPPLLPKYDAKTMWRYMDNRKNYVPKSTFKALATLPYSSMYEKSVKDHDDYLSKTILALLIQIGRSVDQRVRQRRLADRG